MQNTDSVFRQDPLPLASRLGKHAWLLPVLLVVLNAVLTLPEVLTEQIYPWDDSLYAANGVFFLTLFQHLPDVIASPMAWMTDYYHQYPALFVRRQPPLFGIVESGVYGALGVSAISAKLTVFLFSTLFVIGWYFALRAWTQRTSVAFLATLFTVTLPMTVQLSTSVRVDIPALALFVWALYWFRVYQDRTPIRLSGAVLVSVLLASSLYTYQLPMFSVVALFVYWAVTGWPTIFRRVDAYLLAALFSVLMVPLIVFTLKFAFDNVAGVVGPTVKDFERFTPVSSKLSPEYWLYYLNMAWDIYRIPTMGMILWAVSKVRYPIRNWEIFFFIWFLSAYLGFSLFPSKGDRYAFYFVLAVLPLTAGTLLDLWESAAHSRPLVRFLPLCIGGAAVIWNISGIPGFRTPTVKGFDQVAQEIVSTFGSGNALYHGRFESAFIYYLRKEDQARKFRVLRSGNEIADPANLASALDREGISFVVMQDPIEQRGGGYAEIYQPLFNRLSTLLAPADSPYQLWRTFNIAYRVQGIEEDVLLRIFVKKATNVD